MTSKLPTAARALLREHKRRLTLAAHPSLSAPHAADAPRARAKPRAPSTSQLTAENEAYYAGLLLQAVLSSRGNVQTAATNRSDMNSYTPEPPQSPPPERVSDEEWEIRTGMFTQVCLSAHEKGLILLEGIRP